MTRKPAFITAIKNCIPAFLVFALQYSCGTHSVDNLTVESEKVFDSIPSASALIIKNDTAFVICDDGTGMYKLNLQSFQQEKIPLTGLPLHSYRESKEEKHDFESATLVIWKEKEYLVAFGSGTTTKARDSVLMVNTADYNDQKIISLHGFYQQLQSLTGTDSTQWNIEGLAFSNGQLIIANRGNNLLVSCNKDDFFSWLLQKASSFPKIDYTRIHLPTINGDEATLSGICAIDDKRLLFCASVEDTPDWTKDGPVLGSFFGIYSLEKKKLIASYLLKDSSGKPKKVKIESVDVLKKNTDTGFSFYATGDNDDGTSRLLKIKLHARE